MEKKLEVMHQLNDQQKDKVRDLLTDIDLIQTNLHEAKRQYIFITKQLDSVVEELENLLDPQKETKFPF